MGNFGKAVFVTLLTVAPLLVKDWLGQHWSWGWFVAYSLIAFFGYWKFVFKPDARFLAVRQPSLDAIFEKAFESIEVAPGKRFPFRVNVYRPAGMWPLQWLVVAYEWESNPADPDHGKWWWADCALAGKVFRSGKMAFYKKGQDLSEYHLTDADRQHTEHLEAVLCLPLRRPAAKEDERISSKVTAVLAVDALTPMAAAQLEEWHAGLIAGESPLLDKMDWISLYF